VCVQHQVRRRRAVVGVGSTALETVTVLGGRLEGSLAPRPPPWAVVTRFHPRFHLDSTSIHSTSIPPRFHLRPKLSPEKRKVGPAEPASPSKRASVAVVLTWSCPVVVQHHDWSAPGAIQVAARRWLARRYVARLRAAVPLPPPLESGDGAPPAAELKRRVDFSAPVPPSMRACVETGIGAGWLREMARAAAPAAVAAPPPAPVVVVMEVPAPAAAPKRKVSFGAEVSPAKAVAGLQGDDGHDDYSEAEEESVYSEEELGGLEEAEDEWWAQGGGGRGGGCVPVQ